MALIHTDRMYVPQANDTYLADCASYHVITGPNMAGKSTYLHQVALIVILAQIGGFVPASFASIRIVDRLFTRVGSGDRIDSNSSSFMVEMQATTCLRLDIWTQLASLHAACHLCGHQVVPPPQTSGLCMPQISNVKSSGPPKPSS